MRAEKEKLPPTIAELFAEAKDEGREEAKKMLAQELIRENFSDEHIAKLTKLKVEEVARLRELIQ